MINFRFVRSQLKNIRIPLIVFLVVLIILITPTLTQSYLAPSEKITWINEGWGNGSMRTGSVGAMPLMTNIFFGPPGLILMFTISLVLSHLLVSKEIDKGYFGSWITLPMSRKTVLNSKLFILLTSILGLYLTTFIFQLIIFPIKFNDFNLQEFGYLVLYNFAFIFLGLLWASINWFFINSFNKSSLAISIAAGVSILFIALQTMTLFTFIPGAENLKYCKYFTIASFLNSPFKFGDMPFPTEPSGDGLTEIVKAPLKSIKAANFAWQLPVMFILPFGILPVANNFTIKKDLHL